MKRKIFKDGLVTGITVVALTSGSVAGFAQLNTDTNVNKAENISSTANSITKEQAKENLNKAVAEEKRTAEELNKIVPSKTDAEQKLSNSQANYNKIKAEADSKTNDAKTYVNELIKKAENTKTETEKQIQSLNNKKTEANAKFEKLENEVRQATEKVAQAKEKYENAKANADQNLAGKLDNAKTELEAKQTLVTQAEKAIEAAERTLNEANAEKDLAQKQLAEAEKELSVATENLKTATQAKDKTLPEKTEADKDSSVKAQAQQKAQEDFNKANQSLKKAQENLSQAEDNVKIKSEKVKVLEKELSDKQKEKQLYLDAKTKAEKAASDVEKATQTKTTAQATKEQADKAVKEQEPKAEAEKGNVEKAQTQLAEAEKELKEKAAELEKIKKQRSELEEEIKKLEQQNTNTVLSFLDKEAKKEKGKTLQEWIDIIKKSELGKYLEGTKEQDFMKLIDESLTEKNFLESMELIRKSNDYRANPQAFPLKGTEKKKQLPDVDIVRVSASLTIASIVSNALSSHILNLGGNPGHHLLKNEEVSKNLFDTTSAYGENLAWGNFQDNNPFNGWFIEEREDYVTEKPGGQTGHYTNLMNKNFDITGISITNNQKYNVAYEQMFGKAKVADVHTSYKDEDAFTQAYMDDKKNYDTKQLEEKRKQLQALTTTAQEQAVKDAEAKKQQAEAELKKNSETAKLEELKKKLAEAEKNLQSATEAEAQAQKDKAEAETELKKYVDVPEQEITEATQKVNAAKQELQQVEQALEKAKPLVQSAQKEVTNKEKELKEAKAKALEALTKAAKALDAFNMAEFQRQQAEAVLREKEQDKTKADNAIKDNQQKIEDSKKQLTEKQGELPNLKLEVQKAQDALNKLAKTDPNIATLLDALLNEEKAERDAQTKVDDAEATLRNLDNELAKKQEEKTKVDSDLEKLHAIDLNNPATYDSYTQLKLLLSISNSLNRKLAPFADDLKEKQNAYNVIKQKFDVLNTAHNNALANLKLAREAYERLVNPNQQHNTPKGSNNLNSNPNSTATAPFGNNSNNHVSLKQKGKAYNSSNTPNTGDSTPVLPYAVSVVAGLALVATLRKNRKEN